LSAKNQICIVVEGLHAGMVGAYGNSWIRTAVLDDLASRSMVFDQAFVNTPGVEALYKHAWAGDFVRRASDAGLQTYLVTDSLFVAEEAARTGFAERELLETSVEPVTAVDLSETDLARLFGAATQTLAQLREPFCLWIHARALAGAWDAPLELRNQFAEEDDPVPPRIVTPPNHWLPDAFDPDEPLGIKHAYAGQITLLDQCLGAFLDAFEEHPASQRTQLTFLSSGGFPLGEHRRIGVCDSALYNETTQLAWMMRFPDSLGAMARSQALVQPADLPGTLSEWLGLRSPAERASSLLPLIRGEMETLRDCLLMIGPHDHAVRTRAWLLRQPITGAAELYAKPSDRWEVSEVAKLMPEVVEGLQAVLAELVQSGGTSPASLADVLTTIID
jgi:hypothetical protein